MSENVRTALITAAAVLFGGLIAGGSSIATTIVNQDSENERVERRLDEEARGAARVLFSRLTIAFLDTEIVLVESTFPSFPKIFFAPVSAEDLKLITSRLSPEEFLDVEQAGRAATTFFSMVQSQVGLKVTRDDREFVRRLQVKIKHGRGALRGVADLPNPHRPPNGGEPKT